MSTSGSLPAPRAIRISIAAAVATAAGLVAMVAPIDGRADATTSTCTPTANALGAATGWTEFIEGDGTRGAESEGAIAYGGNHSASGMTVGTRIPTGTPSSTPTLVVAGSHGTYNLQRGSAFLDPQSGVNFNGGPGAGYLPSDPIDFAAAFAELRLTSTAWGSAAATGTAADGVAGGNTVLVLTGTNTDLNVFDLTAAQLGHGIAYDVPAGSNILVNVSGTSVTVEGQMWVKEGGSFSQANDAVMENWPGVLWNFPDATSVAINLGSAWGGSILAPNAALTIGGGTGHTIGQMIAKTFVSARETHQRLYPSEACVPTPPTTPPGPSDVTITKTASVASPHGGDTVTYTLTATNVGESPATGVVITDTLPGGVTYVSSSSGCSFASGVVTCPVGTLAPGTSGSATVTVLANPIAGAGPSSHPQASHWLTPAHYEAQVDLEAGEQKSVTLSCPAGGILSDGMFRLDHVDQDTGSISDDVRVLSSQSIGIGSWKGVIRNDATGRAQAKAFIVCLPAMTDPADSQNGSGNTHQHALSADPTPVTTTATYASGQTSATLTCPTGTIPVAPGFDQPAAGATLSGSEYDAAHPRDWTFTVSATAPTTVTLSVRCLRTTVAPVGGHTHELRFVHVVQTVTVPGHTAQEGDEFQVTCPDDAKGIVGTWHLPPGVHHFGNDPRIKTRAFRLYNDSGIAATATLDLLCLRDRTTSEEMGTTEPVVVPNTATVSSVSEDANAFNNSSTASITVQPGSATIAPASGARASASALSLRVVSSMPGTGALRVRSGGVLLAQGSVSLKPGTVSTARVRLTAAGRRQLARLDRVRVTVDPSRGQAVTRTVKVVH